jgi:hypothetical protein
VVQESDNAKSRVILVGLIGRLTGIQQSKRTDPTRDFRRTCRFCRTRSVGLGRAGEKSKNRAKGFVGSDLCLCLWL